MSAIANYQTAIAEFQATEARAEAMAQIIRKGTQALQVWRETSVSNATVGVSPGMSFGNREKTLNAETWPTGQKIADMLNAFHVAADVAKQKYELIPESERKVVQHPQQYGVP